MSQAPRHNPRPWTLAERRLATQMYQEGVPIKIMSERLNRGVPAIYNHMYTAGITRLGAKRKESLQAFHVHIRDDIAQILVSEAARHGIKPTDMIRMLLADAAESISISRKVFLNDQSTGEGQLRTESESAIALKDFFRVE